MSLSMTSSEICAHYRQAKNKCKELSVLAQLNATSAEEIRHILVEGGELAPIHESVGKTVAELDRAGCSAQEIASRLAISPATVNRMRKKYAEPEAAPEPEPETVGNPTMEEIARPFLLRVDAIRCAVPKDASGGVRDAARDLCYALCGDWLDRLFSKPEKTEGPVMHDRIQ